MKHLTVVSLTLLAASPVLAEEAHDPSTTCSSPSPPFGDCFDSKCCLNTNPRRLFGCYRRAGRHYAQCRPYSPTDCTDDDMWLCPGVWEKCSGKGEACIDSKCCSDPNEGCFKRPTKRCACSLFACPQPCYLTHRRICCVLARRRSVQTAGGSVLFFGGVALPWLGALH